MLVDKEENVWLGYQNKGLVLYRKKDNYTKATHLLDHHSVSGMLEDREGGLWFTTLEHGVYYLPPDFLLAYDVRTGLSPAKVKQINFNGRKQ
jgi:ligand-binding sensor domain-containing protein